MVSSPDATPYIDLVLRDMDPQEIIELALQEMQLTIPEWVPRESNIEMVLLEAIAVQIAELIYSANQIPSGVVQAFLKLMGIEYDEGAPPTVTLRFHFTGTGVVSVPEGTSVVMDLNNGDEPILFETVAEATSDGILDYVDVVAMGNTNTSSANGIAVGTQSTLIDSIIFVDYVDTQTEITDGRDPEVDEDYFVRGAQRFQRLTDVIVTPDQFVAFLLEHAAIFRAAAIDMYDVASDPGEDGPFGVDSGFITLAVYGESGPISAPIKTELLNEVIQMVPANLIVSIIDPTINTEDVTITVKRDPSFDPDDVEANVILELNTAFSTQTWDWSHTFYRNDIIAVASRAAGVRLVQSLAVPAADAALDGAAPLLELGTVTVTVVD